MLIDAGHLHIESKLVDKKIKKELESKEQYTEKDFATLKSMLYDKFTCNLSSVQVHFQMKYVHLPLQC
jgi:vacuolar protein sorting-associated protein 13A/C